MYKRKERVTFELILKCVASCILWGMGMYFLLTTLGCRTQVYFDYIEHDIQQLKHESNIND